MMMRDSIEPLFDAETLVRARTQAVATQRHIVTELEALTGVEPRQLMQALAEQVAMRVIETAEMLAQQPAFDRVPLSRAMHAQRLGAVHEPREVDLKLRIEQGADAGLIDPVVAFNRDEAATIIGGVVYRGTALPALTLLSGIRCDDSGCCLPKP